MLARKLLRFAFVAGVLVRPLVSPAGAQDPASEPVGAQVPAAAREHDRLRNFLVRFGAAEVGWVAGAAGAVLVGLTIQEFGVIKSCSGCDDPGKRTTATAIVIGGTVGSALLGAAPKRLQGCTYRRRVAKAAFGSVIGTAAGLAAGNALDVPLLVPILPAVGAAWAQAPCA